MVNQMWIDNQHVDSASKQRFEVINPATEEVIATVPRGTAEDVSKAVAAANAAFIGVRSLSSQESGESVESAVVEVAVLVMQVTIKQKAPRE